MADPPNYPNDYQDNDAEEAIYDSADDVIDDPVDSEDESMNESDLSNNDDFQNIEDEAIVDSEDDLENNADENIVSDSDDDTDNENPGIDSDEQEDDENVFFNNFRETFSLNVEAELNEPLIAEGNLLAVEKFILILAKCLRYKECYASMITSFKIANLSFDNARLPIYMREFWRIVNRRDTDFNNVTVCTICWQELGNGKKPVRDCHCGECGPQRKNSELGQYLYINLRSQIQGLLSKPGMWRDLQYPESRRKSNVDAIEDVYDGIVYRRHSEDGGFLMRGNNNYSLAIWTDGVSPVKSANVGIWPVFIQVLELSPRARQRNSLLAAVYVGPRKPQMAQFLTPVATQLRDLRMNGVIWRTDDELEVHSRFMTLIVSADSEGRYVILQMSRFNTIDGGCTFCYANGVRIGHHTIYRHDDNAADRTDAEIRDDARLAHETRQPQRGVRALSALSIIPDFDFREAQLVEAMHCLWEGNFVRLFQNLKDPRVEHHLTPQQIATISNRITSIKTPTKLSRAPRDLSLFANFKATEYRNMAWYYLLPCAQDFMHADHLNLCAIFAEATFLLNKDCILPDELNRAEELIDLYRQNFEILFPEDQLAYNVHLLKHVVRCVRELGPLWVASGFWFESLNRQVVNYLTSPTDRASQVACRMLLGQMVEKFMDQELAPPVENLLRELIGKERWDEAPAAATGTYFRNDGHATEDLFLPQEIAVLTEAGFADIQLQINRHWRICIDGVRYQARDDRVVKYDNSIAAVEINGELIFIEIKSIVTWQHGGQRQGIFGTRFNTIGPAYNTSYMKIVEELDDLIYVPLRNVVASAVLVRACGNTYISRLANRWDVD